MGTMLHRITIGRTREVRGPDALERGAVGLIVVVVMAVAMWFGVRLMLMAQTLDAVSVARGAQVNAVVYHAEHGRWPTPDSQGIIGADLHGSFFKHLTLGEGGVITAELTLGSTPAVTAADDVHAPSDLQGLLSFRPELLGSKDAPSISFLCGYAKPTAGALAAGTGGRTTVPRKYLPPFCR